MTVALDGDLIDLGTFFAPARTDMVDGLIGEYQGLRQRIEALAELMQGEHKGVLQYFLEGNSDQRSQWYNIDKLFDPAGAISDLDATFWQRTLKLTNILDCMPQSRRDEWHELISKRQTPEFLEDTVRETLLSLLQMRSTYLAERVAGIFHALSSVHLTNQPEGFSKRMIVANVLREHGTLNWRQVGHINDLRAVVAKFMGRDEPPHGSSDSVLHAARRHAGQWMSVDGGALRIRVYAGVGTAHLEVHPDMAWRLNCILASIYPHAIPSQFRKKPKKPSKEFQLMEHPLPFAVVSLLGNMEEGRKLIRGAGGNHWQRIPNSRQFRIGASIGADKHLLEAASRVMEAIGGACIDGVWLFDYNPQSVLDEILCSGCIPDAKSHNFYPTPPELAEMAASLADIQEHHSCLEPSAGHGGLAGAMPQSTTLCLEVNKLHCEILRAKGFETEEQDFLAWTSNRRFDRCLMNPPFSEGRWLAHLTHAASFMADNGKLVAILPASAKGKDILKGFDCTWHGPFENMFAGTSVSVTILEAVKQGPGSHSPVGR